MGFVARSIDPPKDDPYVRLLREKLAGGCRFVRAHLPAPGKFLWVRLRQPDAFHRPTRIFRMRTRRTGGGGGAAGRRGRAWAAVPRSPHPPAPSFRCESRQEQERRDSPRNERGRSAATSMADGVRASGHPPFRTRTRASETRGGRSAEPIRRSSARRPPLAGVWRFRGGGGSLDGWDGQTVPRGTAFESSTAMAAPGELPVQWTAACPPVRRQRRIH